MIPFAAYTTAELPNAFQWAGQLSQNCPFPCGILSHLIVVPWAHTSRSSKRHLDRFSRFCWAHPCDRQTDKQTDHATCDDCSNRPHLCNACDAA